MKRGREPSPPQPRSRRRTSPPPRGEGTSRRRQRSPSPEQRIVRPRNQRIRNVNNVQYPLIIELGNPVRRRTINFTARFAQTPNAEAPFETVLASVSQGLIRVVRRTVRQENINVNPDRITGYLFLNNVSGNGSTYRSARVRINELTPEFLLEEFSKITSPNSNPDLSVADLEYSFWIDPESFIVGAKNNKKSLEGSQYWDPPKEFNLNCCSLAIGIGIVKNDPEYTSWKNQLQRQSTKVAIAEFILKIQDKYFKEEYNSISDIRTFVEDNPKYQIIIYSCFIRTPNIVGDGDIKIILFYDAVEKHFRLITAIEAFIKGQTGNGVKVCKTCHEYSLRESNFVCDCGKVLFINLA
jgi:hypothetical protein